MVYISFLSLKLSCIRLPSLSFFNFFLFNLNNLRLNYFFLLLSISFLFFLNKNWNLYIFFILLLFYQKSSKLGFIMASFYTGYYKIHPPILYFGLLILLFFSLKNKKIFKYSQLAITKVLILALILGSLWALYQSIWGKYWSNDSIEVILVYFVFLTCLKLHHIFNSRGFFISLLLFNGVLLLILLRLNLIYTKHNFFQKTINLQYYYLYSYIVITVWLLIAKLTKFKLYTSLGTFFILVISFQIIFNFINVHFFKILNTFFFYLFIFFFFIYYQKLNNLFLLHWVLLISITILSFFYVNFIKSYYLISTLSKLEYQLYFLKKKKLNFLLFKKLFLHHKFFSESSFFINYKNFSSFKNIKNIKAKLVNSF